MSCVNRTIIVPADKVDLARTLCAAILGSAGEGMFVAALSPSGESPATHYVSTGIVCSEFAGLIPFLNNETGEVYGGNIQSIMELVTQTEAEVASVLESMIVTDSEPFAEFERLGIKTMSQT